MEMDLEATRISTPIHLAIAFHSASTSPQTSYNTSGNGNENGNESGIIGKGMRPRGGTNPTVGATGGIVAVGVM
jgi:hypothetical protein